MIYGLPYSPSSALHFVVKDSLGDTFVTWRIPPRLLHEGDSSGCAPIILGDLDFAPKYFELVHEGVKGQQGLFTWFDVFERLLLGAFQWTPPLLPQYTFGVFCDQEKA